MAEEKELFEAVRTIKSYCKGFPCSDECKIFAYCGIDGLFGKRWSVRGGGILKDEQAENPGLRP